MSSTHTTFKLQASNMCLAKVANCDLHRGSTRQTTNSISSTCSSRSNRPEKKELLFTTGSLVGGKWRLGRKLGSGAFGEVYKAENVRTGELVAVKCEFVKRRKPLLATEYETYKGLRNTETEIFGFPTPRFFGQDAGRHVLVMDFLGKSLDELMQQCGGRLSGKSVAMVGIQMLRRLQLIHHKGFLHRDIKPENMLVGGDKEESRVYLVDYGLAKRYCGKGKQEHIPFRKRLAFIGTSRYASMNAHLGYEQGRKDDVESLGFALLFMLNGRLPWQGLNERDASIKEKKVGEIKQRTRISGLCRRMPEMADYFRYVRRLRFEDRPDYSYLRGLLRGGLKRRGYSEDRVFEWMKK